MTKRHNETTASEPMRSGTLEREKEEQRIVQLIFLFIALLLLIAVIFHGILGSIDAPLVEVTDSQSLCTPPEQGDVP